MFYLNPRCRWAARRCGLPLLLLTAIVLTLSNFYILSRDNDLAVKVPTNPGFQGFSPSTSASVGTADEPSSQLEVFVGHNPVQFDPSLVDRSSVPPDLEYFSIFNPHITAHLPSSATAFNEKLTKVIQYHNISCDSYSYTTSEKLTRIKVPSFYIENYLLSLDDASIPESLKPKITALRQQEPDYATILERRMPFVDKFDYRFTLAVYLHHIKQHIKETVDLNNGLATLENLSLPFSWYDFSDLTILNEDIKLHFFWSWVLQNYGAFPQAFKNQLMLYFYQNNSEAFLNERFNQDRKKEKLSLDNFEMFLREFSRVVDSCEVLSNTDMMNRHLVDLIDDFYDLSFPHTAPKQKKANPDLELVLKTRNKPHITSSKKLEQILRRNGDLVCKDFHNLPKEFKVPFSEFTLSLRQYQPAIGFNVFRGTRNKLKLTQTIMYAKSYLYSYNGLNDADIRPFKITILNENEDEGDHYQINIQNTASKESQRLLETDLVNQYIEKTLIRAHGYHLEELYEDRKNIYIDYLDQYSDLKQTFPPAKLKRHESFESEAEIDFLIDYITPKNELDFHVDSFVNIDSEETIWKIYSKVPEAEFNSQKKKLSSIFLREKIPINLVFEKLFEDNLDADYSNPMKLSRNLFSYYKSVKFSNEFTDLKNVPKYFFEPRTRPEEEGQKTPNTGHYDWRFFSDSTYNQEEIRNTLSHMMQNWLHLTNKYQYKTWLAHGTLFSWYFNAKNFPWDLDMDVQMPIKDLNKLCLRFNKTLIMESPKKGLGLYFLDCSSSITHRSKENGRNNIDARFIDTKTGFYIDITGVSFSGSMTPYKYNKEIDHETGVFLDSIREDAFYVDLERNVFNTGYKKLLEKKAFKNLQSNLKLKIVNCRNNHFVRLEKLLPLRKTLMEGIPAYVPNDFADILDTEYSKKWLKPFFNGKLFIPKLGNWIHEGYIANLFRRFLHLNQAKINEASPSKYQLSSKDLEDYDDRMSNQLKALHENGMDKGYVVGQAPYEEFPYPFNFTDAEVFMILNHYKDHLEEHLLSKQLFEYHFRELEAFNNSKVLTDKERKSVTYTRPDFTLQRLPNGIILV